MPSLTLWPMSACVISISPSLPGRSGTSSPRKGYLRINTLLRGEGESSTHLSPRMAFFRRMHMSEALLALAYKLTQNREPFVLATVVGCERPTSAKPGAQAIIQRDGQITGWIGGNCAQPVV